jgi:hypothetical protein
MKCELATRAGDGTRTRDPQLGRLNPGRHGSPGSLGRSCTARETRGQARTAQPPPGRPVWTRCGRVRPADEHGVRLPASPCAGIRSRRRSPRSPCAANVTRARKQQKRRALRAPSVRGRRRRRDAPFPAPKVASTRPRPSGRLVGASRGGSIGGPAERPSTGPALGGHREGKGRMEHQDAVYRRPRSRQADRDPYRITKFRAALTSSRVARGTSLAGRARKAAVPVAARPPLGQEFGWNALDVRGGGRDDAVVRRGSLRRMERRGRRRTRGTGFVRACGR